VLCYHVWTEAGRAKGCWVCMAYKRNRVNLSWSPFGVAESEVRILPPRLHKWWPRTLLGLWEVIGELYVLKAGR
jgi:hypothetical protein